MSPPPLGPPVPLRGGHVTETFDCRQPSLDDWLQRRALANQIGGASRCFVLADSDVHVLGYYALAAGAVMRELATGGVRRNMPEPVPVMVLGRLALDRRLQGWGYGTALLQDALKRSVQVAEHAGVRALLAHAIDERARDFYLHWGFQPSSLQAMTVMLPLPRMDAG